MEENNNLNNEVPVEEVTTVAGGTEVQENPVAEATAVPVVESISTPEVQTIDGFSNATVDVAPVQEVPVQSEFVTADTVQSDVALVEGTPLKPKKKVNKTLIVVLIFVVIFGGVMLLMSQGGKGPVNNGNKKEEEKQEIKVNVGTEWGNKYLTYLLENKPELKTYEISFIDTNNDEVPEMFLKYKDNSDKESMKILYIADDGYVYESKYYRDYRIRYIYSLKDKTTSWYLFLTSTKHYGSYTMISKVIDEMAFDADIKATNDALLIEYGKKYYDTDYNVIFYTIKENSYEADFKEFISRYDKYVDEINALRTKVEDKYKDYEYKEEVKDLGNTVNLFGRIYTYGTYIAEIPANVENNTPAYTSVIVLYKDNYISINGKMYQYRLDSKDPYLLVPNEGAVIIVESNVFSVGGHKYKYANK